MQSTGAFRYRLTSINSAGLESDPGNEVDSPAVVFDVAFTFGADVLDTPTALALGPAGGRLVAADTTLRELHAFALDGRHTRTLHSYPDGNRADPRGLGFSADGSRLYVTDATLKQCLILDANWQITGRFGTPGKNPGEFESPAAVLCTADRVLVADASTARCRPSPRWGSSCAPWLGGQRGRAVRRAGRAAARPGARIYASDADNDRVQLFRGRTAFEKLLDIRPPTAGRCSPPTAWPRISAAGSTFPIRETTAWTSSTTAASSCSTSAPTVG